MSDEAKFTTDKDETMTTTIDTQGLIDAGLLDLDRVFAQADWKTEEEIASYTSCVYGPSGDQPGTVRVMLQRAEEYGIEAWRWQEDDDCYADETGPITLNRGEACDDGAGYATESDESPDLDELVGNIVATGFFGDADAADIERICEAACGHSCGVLLLPTGDLPAGPPSWTTSGWLECDHVRIDADHQSPERAAWQLLRVITRSDD